MIDLPEGVEQQHHTIKNSKPKGNLERLRWQIFTTKLTKAVLHDKISR